MRKEHSQYSQPQQETIREKLTLEELVLNHLNRISTLVTMENNYDNAPGMNSGYFEIAFNNSVKMLYVLLKPYCDELKMNEDPWVLFDAICHEIKKLGIGFEMESDETI